jgi:hypothetical protein
LAGTAALLTFTLPVILIDLSLELKAPYFSHLQYVLATGSKHGEVISSAGFNIWVFFTEDLPGSSRQPLFLRAGSHTLFSIAPYFAGILLFLGINVFLIYVFARGVRSAFAQSHRAFVVNSLLYFSLVNLSFNLALTGTHERYLFHFYPFILTVCLSILNRAPLFNGFMLTALITAALLYGAFLFAYLNRWVLTDSVSVLRWMSAVHLILFGYLLYAAIRQFDSQATHPSQS